MSQPGARIVSPSSSPVQPSQPSAPSSPAVQPIQLPVPSVQPIQPNQLPVLPSDTNGQPSSQSSSVTDGNQPSKRKSVIFSFGLGDGLSNHEVRSLFQQLGDWGFYQGYVYLVSILPHLLAGIVLVQNTFTLNVADHRCYVDGCDNEPSNTFYREPWWSNVSVSSLSIDKPSDSQRHCQLRATNGTHQLMMFPSNDSTTTTECQANFLNESLINCPNGYVYQYSKFPFSVNSEVRVQVIF